MATTTMTTTVRKKDANLPPESERFLRCCADIAGALIEDHEAAARDPKRHKKDLNLNSLRSKFARKHKVSCMPPLTAIIAAVPEHYKKYILPKLITKPIRKCSDPALSRLDGPQRSDRMPRNILWHCRSGCHVQTSPMSSYRLHRKHLRILPRRT